MAIDSPPWCTKVLTIPTLSRGAHTAWCVRHARGSALARCSSSRRLASCGVLARGCVNVQRPDVYAMRDDALRRSLACRSPARRGCLQSFPCRVGKCCDARPSHVAFAQVPALTSALCMPAGTTRAAGLDARDRFLRKRCRSCRGTTTHRPALRPQFARHRRSSARVAAHER
jgi:hypothetical protein